MKLYYLTALKYPSSYANRAQVMKMAEAFVGNSVDITMFVSRFLGTQEEVLAKYGIDQKLTIKVISEKHKKMRAFWHARALAQEVKSAPENTIFYIRDITLCFWLILFSKRFRKRFFFEAHSIHRFPKFIYKICFFFAKGIITTNNYKRNILEKWNISKENIIVEPNAIDPKRFRVLTDTQTARKKLSLPLNKNIILYLGLFSPDRGSDTFMQVASESPAFLGEFYAVGGKPEQINTLKAQFDIPHLHIKELVPYEEAPLYYSAADVLVAPWSGRFEVSRVAASPLKIPEFMYSGKPLVISDLPMTREWVNESTAFLARPDDTQDFLEKIKYVLTNKEDACRRAREAKRKAQEHTWEKRAERITHFIKQRIN